MADMTYSGPHWTPDEYRAARERLKRLRESPDMNTVPDIVALQGEIARYESALMLLGPSEESDEHELHPGAC
jgi:hypothetical protein